MTTLPQILLSKPAADATHQAHPGWLGRVHVLAGHAGRHGQSRLRYALPAYAVSMNNGVVEKWSKEEG